MTTSGGKAVAKKRVHSENEPTTEKTAKFQPGSANNDKPSAPDRKKIHIAPEAEPNSNHQSALLPSDNEQPGTSSNLSSSPLQSTLNPFSPTGTFDIDQMIAILERLGQKELHSQQLPDQGAMDSVDSPVFIGATYKAISALHEYFTERRDLGKDTSLQCNPLMADSPISGQESPHTMNYMLKRLHKNLNMNTANAGSMVLKEIIRIDVAGSIAMARRAAATKARLHYLKSLMTKLENPRHLSIAEHAKVINGWKEIKLEAATWDGLNATLEINNENAFVQRIIYFHEHTPLIEKAAQELHLTAHQELATLQRAPAGLRIEMPALKLLEAVFVELGQLSFTPNLVVTSGEEEKLTPKQQFVRNLVQEPAGWVAIVDKLKLK